MDPQLESRLKELEEKTEKIFVSVEKTRRYFLWTLIITLVLFFLPLIGLLFVIPTFLNTLNQSLGL